MCGLTGIFDKSDYQMGYAALLPMSERMHAHDPDSADLWLDLRTRGEHFRGVGTVQDGIQRTGAARLVVPTSVASTMSLHSWVSLVSAKW